MTTTSAAEIDEQTAKIDRINGTFGELSERVEASTEDYRSCVE